MLFYILLFCITHSFFTTTTKPLTAYFKEEIKLQQAPLPLFLAPKTTSVFVLSAFARSTWYTIISDGLNCYYNNQFVETASNAADPAALGMTKADQERIKVNHSDGELIPGRARSQYCIDLKKSSIFYSVQGIASVESANYLNSPSIFNKLIGCGIGATVYNTTSDKIPYVSFLLLPTVFYASSKRFQQASHLYHEGKNYEALGNFMYGSALIGLAVYSFLLYPQENFST